MNSEVMTLKDFFGYRHENLSSRVLGRVEESDKYSGLQRKLGEISRSLRWSHVFDRTMKALGVLLEETGLYDIILSAWEENNEFRGLSDREQGAPDEVVLIPLADHTIQSEHHPYLEILVDGTVLGRIDFQVELMLELKGFILEVSRGELRSSQTGTLRGEGRVYCEGILLLQRELAPLQLPGEIDFTDRISRETV